jgi:hypothetical protein
MWDDSNKDGHAETIMDYVISWCLRCTNYQYVKDFHPILYQYCMFMLCKLIGKQQDIDRISIEHVTVKKQEQKVDLWVEIDLIIDNKKERHAILIEDKYYTSVHDDQLKRYRQIFDEYYGNKNDYPEKNRHYALITCLYDVNSHYAPLEAAATVNKYKIYHLYYLVDSTLNYKESESDIFNELFLREWL